MSKKSGIDQTTIAPYILLALHKLGGTGSPKQVAEMIADDLELSEEFLNKKTLKTNTSVFRMNIHLSRVRLSCTGYVDNSERAKWTLTEKAKNIIPALHDEQSHSAFIKEVMDESTKEMMKRRKANKENKEKSTHPEIADEEKDIEKRLVDETQKEEAELEIIKNITPEQFERLCGKLFEGAKYVDVKITQRSRDGGYDGHAFYLFGLTRMKVVFESKRYSDGKVVEGKIKELQQVKTDEKQRRRFLLLPHPLPKMQQIKQMNMKWS